MKELFVKDIRAGDTVTGYFALRKADLKEKDGRYRLALELGDSTGRINAIIWDATKEQAALLQPNQVVKIRGPVATFQDQLQIRIDRIRPVNEEDEYDLGDFFRKSIKSIEELSSLLDSMIEKVENNYLSQLLKAIFDDTDLRKKYLLAPAAKLLHHDYIGGLAEHSLSMAEVALRLADHYPRLNRDFLICGTLLHDIGKIWEYQHQAAIDFSTAGRLIGHINQGDEFICSVADGIDNFPDDLLMHIRHLVISHQGEPEKGSPVRPQTPEAVFLHHVDELDSRMGAVEKIRERTDDAGWSEYSRIFECFFYFGNEEKPEE